MVEVESAWERYPDYRIDIVPCPATAQAWLGDLLLAESDACLRLEETKHVDRLYFPQADVRWELFEPTDHHTICPFKGQADYWSVSAGDPPEQNVLWGYPDPFPQVAAIKGYVAFYHERVRIVLNESWSRDDDPRVGTTKRFPAWGEASDLLALLDVQPSGPNRFVGPAYRQAARNVVEGGQLVGQAIVAASKSIPGQRVTSGYMTFAKAAAFDAPVDVNVDVLRPGRTFSTVEVRIEQGGSLRSAGLFLFDAGTPDLIHRSIEMPSVAGPYDSEPLDMGVTGRDLRVVDGAYSPDPDRVGPPEIYTWCRFAEAPAEPYLHTALMVQSMTHWTIAAALRPHPGYGEADAHVTLSTGIMSIGIAFHDDVDVSGWLLYANPAIYAGRGLAQGEGHVFTRDGRLVASYSVQAMIRPFAREPGAMGVDTTTAM